MHLYYIYIKLNAEMKYIYSQPSYPENKIYSISRYRRDKSMDIYLDLYTSILLTFQFLNIKYFFANYMCFPYPPCLFLLFLPLNSVLSNMQINAILVFLDLLTVRFSRGQPWNGNSVDVFYPMRFTGHGKCGTVTKHCHVHAFFFSILHERGVGGISGGPRNNHLWRSNWKTIKYISNIKQNFIHCTQWQRNITRI